MIQRTLVFLLAVFSSGCLSSPLLNHADARDGYRSLEQDCQLSFPSRNLCASLEWKKNPTTEEAGELEIRFWNAEEASQHGPYVDPGFSVGVKLWMPHHGHGSSPVQVSPALGGDQTPIPGIFKGSNVYFVMGGHWEIWVQLKSGQSVVEQSKIDYDL